MPRYVIVPEVAIALAAAEFVPTTDELLAPTLLRSQLLAVLYERAQAGLIDADGADAVIDHLRAMKVRLLGDRVLQRRAWKLAGAMGASDTLLAEYLALTQLQADALIVANRAMATEVAPLVETVSVEAFLSSRA